MRFLRTWQFSIEPQTWLHSVFTDGALCLCFCSWHSPVWGMNVRGFLVRATECMRAQTRFQFLLSPQRVTGSGVMLTPRTGPHQSNGSEEGGTRDAASRRTWSPGRYQLGSSGPDMSSKTHCTPTLPGLWCTGTDLGDSNLISLLLTHLRVLSGWPCDGYRAAIVPMS